MKKLESLKGAKVLSSKEQQLLRGGAYAWWTCSSGSNGAGNLVSTRVWADGFDMAKSKAGIKYDFCFLSKPALPTL